MTIYGQPDPPSPYDLPDTDYQEELEAACREAEKRLAEIDPASPEAEALWQRLEEMAL